MKLSEEKLENIVRSQIGKDHKLGDQSGGSGHMAYVGLNINQISEPEKVGDLWKIRYKYTTIITSEFTVYPENPPREYKHSKTIIINSEGQIINDK